MKNSVLPAFILIISVAALHCKGPGQTHSNGAADCYQGILKIKGPCGQRVIGLLGSDNAGAVITDTAWTNEATGESIKKAFSVANVCDFPEKLNVGDTLYFKIIGAPVKTCNVCFAFIPVPESRNNIQTGCEAQ